MLISLAGLVKRGLIDNTHAGSIKLSLWGADDQRPVQMVMAGDCSPDIAGCLVRFDNQSFEPAAADPWDFLEQLVATCKEWRSGDITLSCRRRESNNRGMCINMISLEFFAGTQARLLLESECVDYEISMPQWQPDAASANLQYLMSMDNMRAHIEHSLQLSLAAQEATCDKDFPRCDWDKVLNRAETSVNIALSLKGKYSDCYSELASIAYIFNLPETLQSLACEEETDDTLNVSDVTPDLGLFDYLPSEQAELIKEAMAHPLFTCTSEMTELIFTCLNRAMELDIYTPEQTNAIRVSYATIVSRILASILLVQQNDTYSLEMVRKRIQHMQHSLRTLLKSLPPKREELSELKDAAHALISSLDDFSRELSHH
ncbi:MAG: hypothetical protein R3Y56_08675 [Akkermansia sp.]